MAEIIILGGPNGAGKTTAATLLFRRHFGSGEFVNADEIARGLSPFNPEKAAIAAGRLMIARMNDLANAGRSFVVETTCSGRSNLNFFRNRKADGWKLSLLFLWLPSPQMAIERVARRVRQGGHFIPDEAVVRRYWAGLKNLQREYLPMVDVAAIYDNTLYPPTLIAERHEGQEVMAHDATRWLKVLESTR